MEVWQSSDENQITFDISCNSFKTGKNCQFFIMNSEKYFCSHPKVPKMHANK